MRFLKFISDERDDDDDDADALLKFVKTSDIRLCNLTG